MKTQIEQRLKELKTEFESGRKMLAELQQKQANLQETLLRISGAIQVLGEEIARQEETNNKPGQAKKSAAKKAVRAELAESEPEHGA
ncbi:MAG: hypothetical protein ACE5I1_01955 [bacterium]